MFLKMVFPIAIIYFIVYRFIYPLLPFGFNDFIYDIVFFAILAVYYFLKTKKQKAVKTFRKNTP